ncbi:hypothetical protein V8C42DRAFT_189413 [Trichoderma barbatum]
MHLSVHYMLWSLLLQQLVYCRGHSGSSEPEFIGSSSKACNAAFRSPKKCNGKLQRIAFGKLVPTQKLLSEICTDACLSELKDIREALYSACRGSEYTGTRDVRYPATYHFDLLLFTYNYVCVKDQATGDYFSPKFFKWNSNIEDATSAQLCSDCNLLVQQAHFDYPIGYDEDLASAYSSLTSSCGVTKYPISSQPAYALDWTKPPAATTSSKNPTQTDSKMYAGMGYKKGPGFQMNTLSSLTVSFVTRDYWITKSSPNAETGKKGTGFQLDESASSSVPFEATNTEATSIHPNAKANENLPLAPGTADSCERYTQYVKTTSKEKNINECVWVLLDNKLKMTQFLSWNPSLSFDYTNPSICVLLPGYRYCISEPLTITGNSFAEHTFPQSPTITYSLDDSSDGKYM